MKFIKYKKYVPEPASEMSMEDLLNALSDYLLQSGFQQQYHGFLRPERWQQSLDDLSRPSPKRCMNSDLLDEQMREQIENMSGRAARAAHRATHRSHGAGGLHQHRPAARSCAAVERRRTGGRAAIAGELRDHRQEPRLSRLQARCATCWARWANRTSAGTIRATWRLASRPAARRRPTSSATR